MKTIDLTAETDLDTVAQIAYELAERLREECLRELHDELVNLCRRHPVKAAQIITTLAAWFDPETSTATLWDRVEAITRARIEVARA